ncbi:MAG TPA: non-heme iron oxygenase ferredoxin subunit [Bacillota bacterium]|nr:non-heme iron oxygenase ferredoxin subunit [Bacillota bacterium]
MSENIVQTDGEFVYVAELDAFDDEEMNLFTIDSEQIIVSLVEDEFFAFSGICSHAYAEMINGDLDGHYVTCPLHFSEFDIRDGCPLDPPATEPLKTFDVLVKDEKVYVNPKERTQNDG